jgi:hypothetical protein
LNARRSLHDPLRFFSRTGDRRAGTVEARSRHEAFPMTHAMSHKPVAALLAVTLGAASSAVFAQTSPALDRVGVWLGGYYSNNTTDLSARGRGDYAGIHGKLGFEHDLGFDKHTLDPRVRLDFLVGDSQGFSFDYYRIHRNETRTYSAPIEALDTTANATIRGRLNYDFGSASYRWWFGHESDVFGLGVGAAYYKVDMRLTGSGSVAGDSGSASTGYHDSEWAPMLTLGWRHAFNDQWRMYADASGVKKNGGDLSGHIWNADLGVEWFPWQNVGFALEYTASKLHLHKDYHDATAKLDLKSNGPAFYVRMRF